MSIEKKFCKLVNNVDVISFDIFDTLLIRPYNEPKDLFLHLEKLFEKKDFCRKRILAEKAARERNCLGNSDEDIEFKDIYKNIPEQYVDLEAEELALEAKVLRPNPYILLFWEYAKKSGKKIIATSDMYLTEDFLRELLDKNGFEDVSKIYVSSKYKCCKGSKNLYKVVLDDLNISAQKVLHIGDNLSSDYFRAKECGLNALVIPKTCDKLWEKRLNKIKTSDITLEVSVLSSFYSQYLSKCKTYWQNIGYCLGGPFVIGYLQDIIKLSSKENIDTLLFISRDGYVLREAYNILIAKNAIENYYIYAPRILDLKCFLDYKNVPDYLQSLLSIAKNIYPQIEDIPKNYTTAQELFKVYEKDLTLWAENNKKEYSDYLKSLGIKGNRIATIDMTTGAFSSISFLTKFLKEKLVMGFFSCAFGESSKFNYHIFYDKILGNRDTAMVNLSEFLITAPEPPCSDIVNNAPAFMDINKFEQKKLEVYPEVMQGILDFVKDYKDIFGDFEIIFQSATIIDLWNSFLATPTLEDKKHFSNIYHAEDCCSGKYRSLYSYMGLNLFCKKYIRIPLIEFKRKCKRDLSNKVKYFLYENTKFRVKTKRK